MHKREMPQKGVSFNAALGELPTAPLEMHTYVGSFDLKAIRERMAFGAQDDRVEYDNEVPTFIVVVSAGVCGAHVGPGLRRQWNSA